MTYDWFKLIPQMIQSDESTTPILLSRQLMMHDSPVTIYGLRLTATHLTLLRIGTISTVTCKGYNIL